MSKVIGDISAKLDFIFFIPQYWKLKMNTQGEKPDRAW
jgi:hypothetical protein